MDTGLGHEDNSIPHWYEIAVMDRRQRTLMIEEDRQLQLTRDETVAKVATKVDIRENRLSKIYKIAS
jgi:hypothetical protein